ncbi:MAG TPA: type VI secretion system-associated FHA domain protein TagH [Stellaceae bacterium]|jgi:type VI secretion system FHA domain protein|nr:type VI secretion system-associated FHA domain protein TagH [Stellaceae bacterium]
MDELNLTITAYQGRSCPPQSRQVEQARFTIGRGTECDWELPDPSRLLSRVHCTIERVGNRFTITDVSTNGTRLNGAREPLGRNVSAELSGGDQLELGEYRIQVELNTQAAMPASPPFGGSERLDLFPPLRPSPAVAAPPENPFAGLMPGAAGSPFGLDMARPAAGPFDVLPDRLPPAADLPPLAPPSGAGLQFPPGIDPSPAVNANFRPPDIRPPLIPTDWNAPQPEPAPPSPLPEPQPRVAPAPERMRPVDPPTVPPMRSGAAAEAMRAFLDGAGLSGAAPPSGDDLARLRAYGVLFRELVAGFRELVAARALVKSTFRMPQTVVAARDNNPFKFNVDVNQVVAAMLISDVPGYAEPMAALHEMVADLKGHELALVAALQQALNALVASLSPDTVRRLADAGGLLANLLPAARKAAWWDSYETEFRRAAEGIESDLPGGFRRAFIDAYIEQVKKL